MTVPCSWDVTCNDNTCSGWSGYTDDVKNRALWLASTFLWAATGRRYGVCPVTVRPSQRHGNPVSYQAYPVQPGQDPVVSGPFLFGGRWFNAGCASACCGNTACAVVLRGPVAEIIEVWVDGDVVPPSAYRVDVMGGAWWLVRTDGSCWPTCNRVAGSPGQDGVFTVEYGQGVAIPPALSIATALLACEYAQSLIGGDCQLPAKMTSLTRQGVEVQLADPADLTDDGLTGIKEVDDVITALNPGKLKSPPRVLSLDLPEQCDRVTVWAGGS